MWPLGARELKAKAAGRADLPRLRRPSGGRGLERLPGPERLGRGRRDRPPRRRQPRDRGGARRRADRAGDPARAAAQRRGPGGSIARPRRPAPGTKRLTPTTSRAARSRSPTQVSSGRCWRHRSSTSRRWRSSTSRRSSSGPSSIERRRRRLDRDPADGLPLHVVGPPRPRRRRGRALPRQLKRGSSREVTSR